MAKLYYLNCSELIADFNVKDPKEFLRMLLKLTLSFIRST